MAEQETTERVQGIVKFFNDAKGYGFVSREDGPDVFLHASAIPKETELGEGDRVSFELVPGPRGVKAAAVRLEG